MKEFKGESESIFDVIDKAKAKLKEEQRKFNAMTDEQKDAYMVERKKKDAETEEILKKLRGGSGFMEMEIK